MLILTCNPLLSEVLSDLVNKAMEVCMPSEKGQGSPFRNQLGHSRPFRAFACRRGKDTIALMVDGVIEAEPLIPLSPFLIADITCGIEVFMGS